MGFEPTVTRRLQRFSRPSRSARLRHLSNADYNFEHFDGCIVRDMGPEVDNFQRKVQQLACLCEVCYKYHNSSGASPKMRLIQRMLITKGGPPQ